MFITNTSTQAGSPRRPDRLRPLGSACTVVGGRSWRLLGDKRMQPNELGHSSGWVRGLVCAGLTRDRWSLSGQNRQPKAVRKHSKGGKWRDLKKRGELRNKKTGHAQNNTKTYWELNVIWIVGSMSVPWEQLRTHKTTHPHFCNLPGPSASMQWQLFLCCKGSGGRVFGEFWVTSNSSAGDYPSPAHHS